ncbi:MAG: amidase [Gammaproteobacteria bacterium]|nr:amidase [Gammaproteobacteria bacterium]MDE0226250.1 amidase [Gammaproteobacteria bacterium]
MSDLAFKPALELAAMIRNREIRSAELTEHYIERIEKLDGQGINAVPVRTFERAREDADRADAAMARGEQLGPLHGVPMTIKESYVMRDTPSTWGLEAFRDNIGRTDGIAVSRFRAAGAVFLGKTNVPANLADFQTYNPLYGTTGNPWDTDRIPGGSSGGSAAALAAGFCALEAGSDIGGSIRNPAHFCGVYGHKPTWGIVPMAGHELLEHTPDADLSVCGPLARSADDLAVALDTMAGAPGRERRGWRLELPPPEFNRLGDLRVALWPDDSLCPVATEISDRVVSVGQTLARLGATVSDTARPGFDVKRAHDTYVSLLNSVMSAPQPEDEYARNVARAAEFDPADMSFRAVSARGMVLNHREWIRYNFKREHLRFAWDDFFEDWDILLCPQMATPAFTHDHRPFGQRTIDVDGVQRDYFEQLFWSGLVTNAYLPSTVFPTGLSRGRLPIGIQAVGAAYRDRRTIEFARLMADEIGGFQVPVPLVESVK